MKELISFHTNSSIYLFSNTVFNYIPLSSIANSIVEIVNNNFKNSIKDCYSSTSAYDNGYYSKLYETTNKPSNSSIQITANNANKSKITNNIGEVDYNKVSCVIINISDPLIDNLNKNKLPTIKEIENIAQENSHNSSYDFSSLTPGETYRIGTPQFESIWSTTEKVLGKTLTRPTADCGFDHGYQCSTLVRAVIKDINNIEIDGNGRDQARNAYNSYPDKFELLSTADDTLNSNSIINNGAIISYWYTESNAEALAAKYNDIKKEEFLKYGHVSVNAGGNDNGIRIIEGNKDTKGAIKLSDIGIDILYGKIRDGIYSKIEIANPIR